MISGRSLPADKRDEVARGFEGVGALALAMLPSRGGVEVEMNSVGPGSLAEASRRAVRKETEQGNRDGLSLTSLRWS
jgi:hypothetical protein